MDILYCLEVPYASVSGFHRFLKRPGCLIHLCRGYEGVGGRSKSFHGFVVGSPSYLVPFGETRYVRSCPIRFPPSFTCETVPTDLQEKTASSTSNRMHPLCRRLIASHRLGVFVFFPWSLKNFIK